MSVELVIGPMFSGKTTTLLTYEKKFQITNKKYLCINHSFDTRYTSEGKLATHDGKVSSGKHVTVTGLNEIESYILYEFDAFIIDEVQFFKDIDKFVSYWSSKGKHIVCAGLNSDYKLEPFDSISKLIPKCDHIHHLTALCVDCNQPAPFTERCVESKEQTLVGSGDIYKPKCRKHHKMC
jgi:thymidine kinase